MQRWTSVLVGLLVAVGLVFVFIKAGPPRAAPKPKASASTSASAEAPPMPVPSGSAVGELAIPDLEPVGEDNGDSGSKLPGSAPAAVSFGVILFTYQGAQFAPANARTKQEALAKAKEIIEDAKKDFADAVKKGDKGSTADAGRIPRGVLEPDVELALFSLEKGAVHPEPIDTPRGYWVLRRVE
jgi:hypothetical protein